MDQPVRVPIQHIALDQVEVYIPMPVYPVIEDVGWWQGEDGSAIEQPYRNGFGRRHCLADYQALVRLAKRLGVRIGLGIVLGEWDRNNVLKDIPGASWLGKKWDNRRNQGPWLDEAAAYLRANRDNVELGMHGLCHEFWNGSVMERSEFHDQHGIMRSPAVIRAHLDGFAAILNDNGLPGPPRLFLPPALNHSFGDGEESIQAILMEYGIRYVITRFARAHQFAPPHHALLTWECGVGLLERGLSPVPWHQSACTPVWDISGPILPLHWGNLLHIEPERNTEIVDGWAEMLIAMTTGPEYILAADIEACWHQVAMLAFGRLSVQDNAIVIDPGRRPSDIPGAGGPFWLNVHSGRKKMLAVRGAELLTERSDGICIRSLHLLPEKGSSKIELVFS